MRRKMFFRDPLENLPGAVRIELRRIEARNGPNPTFLRAQSAPEIFAAESDADERFGDRREQPNPKMQLVHDLDQDAGRRFLERPDYIHSLGPGFQVMETNLAAVAIDGLLRGPRDWQAPTTRGHDNKIAMRAAFEVADVTVMRQNFRPQLEVRGGFEDRVLRCANDDRVRCVHDRSSG